MEYAAWLPQIVTHLNGDHRLIQLQGLEPHAYQLRKRQSIESIRSELAMSVGYFSCGRRCVHLLCSGRYKRKNAPISATFDTGKFDKIIRNLNLIITDIVGQNGNQLRQLQRKYFIGAALVAPISPFLYLQGRYTRWKVGVLPPAGGPKSGRTAEGEAAKLLVIGESTVAGLGARTHDLALAGQFAKHLAAKIRRPVEWTVVGRSGVTARQTIEELLPQVPDDRFDYILIGLGGNDVLKLSTPARWRNDMTELLGLLRSKNPDAVMFLSNCPMICLSPALPNPLRAILWELSKMHNDNIAVLTAQMERVFYYPQPVDVPLEGFFADGIHPSERGYAEWAVAMMRYFTENHEW